RLRSRHRAPASAVAARAGTLRIVLREPHYVTRHGACQGMGGPTSAPIGIAETKASALGTSRRFMVSALWPESAAAEGAVFVLHGRALVRRLGPHSVMAVAAMAGVVRWVVMGSTTAVAALALVQPLHGFTFAALHLACMRCASSRRSSLPDWQSASQDQS